MADERSDFPEDGQPTPGSSATGWDAGRWPERGAAHAQNPDTGRGAGQGARRRSRDGGRWLDQDAAERLLSGPLFDGLGGSDGLGGGDPRARLEATRLAAALDALAAEGRPHPAEAVEEMRGEAAALAAFRKAREGQTYVGPVPVAGQEGAVAGDMGPGDISLGTTAPGAIRIGRAHGAGGQGAGGHRAGGRTPRRRARWGRPVRFGLAATLAGFMVGGVAFAATTGVLPSPFGGSDEPSPGSSVSVAATGDESLASPSPDPTTEDGGRSGESTPDGTPSDRPDVAPSSRGAQAQPGGASSDPGSRSDDKQRSESASERWTRVVASCRDYRKGTLDTDRRRMLEDDAHGAERVSKFCTRVLDLSHSGRENGGDSSGSGDGKGDDGNDSGGKDGSGDSEGGWGGWGGNQDGAVRQSGGVLTGSPSYETPSFPVPTPSASYSALPTLLS
ncbi:hypothetical protein ACWCP6_04660 [Streptomyces sp. NPDC002004]